MDGFNSGFPLWIGIFGSSVRELGGGGAEHLTLPTAATTEDSLFYPPTLPRRASHRVREQACPAARGTSSLSERSGSGLKKPADEEEPKRLVFNGLPAHPKFLPISPNTLETKRIRDGSVNLKMPNHWSPEFGIPLLRDW